MNTLFIKSLALLAAAGVGLPAHSQGQPPTTPACIFTLAGGATPQCPVTPTQSAQATSTAPQALTAAPTPRPLISAPALAPEPLPAPPVPSWDLSLKDVTLAEAMTRWSRTAGWRVLWDLDKHVLIDSPDVYRGSFEQAITAVLSSPGLANGPYPLEVCFYPNTPPLARITRRGNQAKDCT